MIRSLLVSKVLYGLEAWGGLSTRTNKKLDNTIINFTKKILKKEVKNMSKIEVRKFTQIKTISSWWCGTQVTTTREKG